MSDHRPNLFKQMTLIMLVVLIVTGCSVDENLDTVFAKESPSINEKAISKITINPGDTAAIPPNFRHGIYPSMTGESSLYRVTNTSDSAGPTWKKS